MRRNGLYYLGVQAPEDKPPVGSLSDDPNAADFFEKVEIRQIPNVPAMIPRITLLSRKGVERFDPPEGLVEGYREGRHKKGPGFDRDFMHELVDYFKRCIAEKEEWDCFGFRFSDTSEYDNIGQFYREVADQAYRIRFARIAEPTVRKLVDDGRLYLFKVACRDFEPGAHGRKNLHTLYWESLFSERNVADPRIKLCGGAELFFRPRSIEDPYVHRKGSKLVNRWIEMTDGTRKPLPEDVHREIFEHANGERDRLSPEARRYIESGRVEVKTAWRDIVKDRRYAEDRFLFHVPVTLNFRATGPGRLNGTVNAAVIDDPDVRVVAVARGRDGLLAAACVDRAGRVVEARSLDDVCGTDYRAKLKDRERLRRSQQRSWKSQDRIKDLESGYVSQAVHEVADMMARNGAVLVLEAQMPKRGGKVRAAVGASVYASFSRKIVSKLGYLVTTKDEARATEPGGAMRGFQLAYDQEQAGRAGRQNGFVYRMPSRLVRGLDPATGFASLFPRYLLRYRSVASSQRFFAAFDSIRYDRGRDRFELSFRYSAFPEVATRDPRDSWTVCAPREGAGGGGAYDCMRAALDGAGIEWRDGRELRDDVSSCGSREALEGLMSAFAQIVSMRRGKPAEHSFLSPAPMPDGNLLGAGKALAPDVVAAVNLARKGSMSLSERMFSDDGKGPMLDLGPDPTGAWLEYAQAHPIMP